MPSTKKRRPSPPGVHTKRDDERRAVHAAIRRANQREKEIQAMARRLERAIQASDSFLDTTRVLLTKRLTALGVLTLSET